MAKSNKSKLPIRRYLIYILIATLLMSGMTFSRYVSTSSGGDSVQVAIFASDVEVTVPLRGDMAPGESQDITITVSNYEGDKVSEVSQQYTLSAELMTGRIPLTLEWDVDEGDFFVGDNPIGEGQECIHTLTVTWPEDNNDYTLADELEVIRVIVHVEQID